MRNHVCSADRLAGARAGTPRFTDCFKRLGSYLSGKHSRWDRHLCLRTLERNLRWTSCDGVPEDAHTLPYRLRAKRYVIIASARALGRAIYHLASAGAFAEA